MKVLTIIDRWGIKRYISPMQICSLYEHPEKPGITVIHSLIDKFWETDMPISEALEMLGWEAK